jgi:hypothetical protein
MRDLSHLPGPDRDVGWAPDPEPELAPILAQEWARTNDDSLRRLTMEDPRLTFSQAAKCARALGYAVRFRDQRRALGSDEKLSDEQHAKELAVLREHHGPTNPMDEAGFWVTGIGRQVHELWQRILMVTYPDAEVEVQSSLTEHGLSCYGLADAVMLDNNQRLVVELKTINGFGFKMAVGARGAPEGPRRSAVTQLCLNALALGAERAKLIYLSLENLSPRELRKLVGGDGEAWMKFAAEWTIDRDTIEAVALPEIKRMSRVLEVVDEGKLPPRMIPGLPRGAVITDPSAGAWQVNVDGQILDTGTTWECGYCDWRERCIGDGA